MHDLSKLAAQVRGARALLGWSQSYLAEGISVRRMIIADFESCKREPQEALRRPIAGASQNAIFVHVFADLVPDIAPQTTKTSSTNRFRHQRPFGAADYSVRFTRKDFFSCL